MKYSFTLIWKGILIIPDKQKVYRSKIRNVSKGHSFSLLPLRFWWKKWINHPFSRGKKNPESFPSIAYIPSLSLPWGQRLNQRVHLGDGTAHTQLNAMLPATDSATPWVHEQREAGHYRKTAQGFKLGGVSGSMCHMLKLCPPSQFYQWWSVTLISIPMSLCLPLKRFQTRKRKEEILLSSWTSARRIHSTRYKIL